MENWKNVASVEEGSALATTGSCNRQMGKLIIEVWDPSCTPPKNVASTEFKSEPGLHTTI